MPPSPTSSLSGDNLVFARLADPFCSPVLIRRPTLIVDAAKTRRNIARMAGRAAEAGVRFRPHFKTHQSRLVGEWFREAGVDCITVSSLEMARYFADAGWDDITVAFPVNICQIDRINQLARSLKLGLMIENLEAADFLCRRLEHRVAVWIKLDAGYGRAGVRWDDRELMIALADRIESSAKMTLVGLLTHSGHSYSAGSRAELQEIHDLSIERLEAVRDLLRENGRKDVGISIGDTPTCRVAKRLEAASEIRPGNFVFYDLMQLAPGVCAADEISAGLACPIVGIYPARNEIVIYGGAIHFSKEFLTDTLGRRFWGQLAVCTRGEFTPGEPPHYVKSLSQEHGVVSIETPALNQLRIGDAVLVLPVHSCLTCQQFASYTTLDGELLPRLSI